MKRIARTGWTLLVWCGFALWSLPVVQAVEVVSYTPGTSFTFHPTTGNSNENFGSVSVQSESPSGWLLTVRSANQGGLKHVGSSYQILYTLTVDGTLVDLSSGTDVTAKTATGTPCAAGCNFSLLGTISAAEIDGKPAGQYGDTLVFTLINQ